MDKTTFGLIAAIGALASAPAMAAVSADVTDQILRPRTVAELLEPIAKPVETLAAVDAARKLEPVEVAQIGLGPDGVVIGRRYHHHHRQYNYNRHHHHHYMRRHHHHNYNY